MLSREGAGRAKRDSTGPRFRLDRDKRGSKPVRKDMLLGEIAFAAKDAAAKLLLHHTREETTGISAFPLEDGPEPAGLNESNFP